MEQDDFWCKCIEYGLDPLWAYRYLCWRLGHSSKREWRQTNSVPGPQQVFRVVIEDMKRESFDDGEYLDS